MMDLIRSVEFWVSVCFAVIVKLRASPTLTKKEALFSTIAAILGAMALTDFVAEYLQVASQNATFAVAAAVALTCEHVARLALSVLTAINATDILRYLGLRK